MGSNYSEAKTLLISDVVRSKIKTVRTTDTLVRLKSVFLDTSHEMIPVVDLQGDIQGIVFRADLLKPFVQKKGLARRLVLDERSAYHAYSARAVSELMRKRFVKVRMHDSLDSAMRIMIEHRLTSVPVVTGDQFRGLVTWDSIIRLF